CVDVTKFTQVRYGSLRNMVYQIILRWRITRLNRFNRERISKQSIYFWTDAWGVQLRAHRIDVYATNYEPIGLEVWPIVRKIRVTIGPTSERSCSNILFEKSDRLKEPHPRLCHIRRVGGRRRNEWYKIATVSGVREYHAGRKGRVEVRLRH